MQDTAVPRAGRGVERPGVGRGTLILLAIASLCTTILISINVLTQQHSKVTIQPSPAADPLVLAALPPFALTRQDGTVFTHDQLKGKVWIADFVFTRCSGPCPMMTNRMSQLEKKLRERNDWGDIHLVTFTVDPTHDTPDVLREYAAAIGADTERWVFLTGDRDRLWQLTKDGFKLPVFENATDPAMPIAHSQKFVLVDQHSRIRGYYDALESQGYEALLRDVDRVLQE